MDGSITTVNKEEDKTQLLSAAAENESETVNEIEAEPESEPVSGKSTQIEIEIQSKAEENGPVPGVLGARPLAADAPLNPFKNEITPSTSSVFSAVGCSVSSILNLAKLGLVRNESLDYYDCEDTGEEINTGNGNGNGFPCSQCPSDDVEVFSDEESLTQHLELYHGWYA